LFHSQPLGWVRSGLLGIDRPVAILSGWPGIEFASRTDPKLGLSLIALVMDPVLVRSLQGSQKISPV
jgi:hypothetical protein